MRRILFFTLWLSLTHSLLAVKDSSGTKLRNVRLNEFSRHYAGANLMPLAFNSLGGYYQFITSGGGFGIKTSLIYNVKPRNYYADSYTTAPEGYSNDLRPEQVRKFAARVDLNIYPGKQKRASYYIGLGISAGFFDYMHPDIEKMRELGYCIAGDVNSEPPQIARLYASNGLDLGVGWNHGFLFRIYKWLFFDLQGTFGLSFHRTDAEDYISIWPGGQAGIGLSFPSR